MDRLDAMSVFVATVETGSLSAAGRRLGMPLATVSRKVADLEAQLHARLLHRSTRKLTLTDAGENYLAACKRILAISMKPSARRRANTARRRAISSSLRRSCSVGCTCCRSLPNFSPPTPM